MGWTEVFNHLLSNYKVETEDQGSGVQRQVVKVAESTDSVPAHDYKALTYVAAGNGAGEIETITYKTGGSGGTTVATTTITYNASDKIATVTTVTP